MINKVIHIQKVVICLVQEVVNDVKMVIILKKWNVINVKKNIYEWYRTHSIVEKNHIVDSIYADKGISGLLDYAIDDNGKLIRNGKEGNYIIYLCYQHNIYFFSEYNDMYTYVNAKTIKKNISLFNQSTKIKRYYQTKINGEYTKWNIEHEYYLKNNFPNIRLISSF